MSHFDNSYLFSFDEDDIDPPGGANVCPHCSGEDFSCEFCDGVGIVSDEELEQYGYSDCSVCHHLSFFNDKCENCGFGDE